jgi:hypothetical protein
MKSSNKTLNKTTKNMNKTTKNINKSLNKVYKTPSMSKSKKRSLWSFLGFKSRK